MAHDRAIVLPLGGDIHAPAMLAGVIQRLSGLRARRSGWNAAPDGLDRFIRRTKRIHPACGFDQGLRNVGPELRRIARGQGGHEVRLGGGVIGQQNVRHPGAVVRFHPCGVFRPATLLIFPPGHRTGMGGAGSNGQQTAGLLEDSRGAVPSGLFHERECAPLHGALGADPCAECESHALGEPGIR